MTTASQTPTPPTAVRAAEGVITASMERGDRTPREWAQAEHDAGILFDPKRAQDIADAAAEQAHAEDHADLEGCRAELADARRELGAMAGAQRKVDAVTRLIESRPGSYMVAAAEIGAALEYGTTPYDAFPMTLTWSAQDGVDIPGPDDTGRRAIVHCRSVHGQRADLIVEGDDRMKLASQIGSEFRDARVPCPEQWCGHEQDWDPADPALFGWSRLQIASTGDVPRWYCSDMCVIDALTRAGHDLAADDQAAAIDPHQQGHTALAEDEEEAARRSVDRAFPAVAAFLQNTRDESRQQGHTAPAEAAAVAPGTQGYDLPYGGDLLAEETRQFPEAALDGADDRDALDGAW